MAAATLAMGGERKTSVPEPGEGICTDGLHPWHKGRLSWASCPTPAWQEPGTRGHKPQCWGGALHARLSASALVGVPVPTPGTPRGFLQPLLQTYLQLSGHRTPDTTNTEHVIPRLVLPHLVHSCIPQILAGHLLCARPCSRHQETEQTKPSTRGA